MATDDEQREDKSSKGFAGLSSMVSDVDATVTQAEKPKPEPSVDTSRSARASPAPQPQPARGPEPGPQPYQQTPQAPSAGSSAGKWLLGIGAAIGFIWLLSESGNKSSPPVPVYTPSSPPSVSRAPAPTFQPPPVPAKPQAPSRPSEEQPPVGTNNVLGPAQIRYCLAEDIRLDGAKGALNNYVGSDVDRFNAMVADYNSRCGQFRYRRGALESAKSEIESIRVLLQSEGRSRFARGPNVGTRQTPSASAASTPDATILAMQRRLNDLGYDAGAADGFAGSKTRAAIAAFQRDQGLQVNGIASAPLLQRANNVETRVSNAPSPERTDPKPRSSQLDLSRLNAAERQSIEAACSNDKYLNGPAAYNSCLSTKLQAFERQGPRPDLSRLNTAERQSIEAACSNDKYLNGPAAYNSCLATKLEAFSRQAARPDLSRLNTAERQSIEAACSNDKYLNGPAAYNSCLSTKLQAFERQGTRPDLSRLNTAERQSIEAACSNDKYLNGPAAYNSCLSTKLQAFERQGPRPDLSRLNTAERQSIEAACSNDKYLNGPAAYNSCLMQRLSQGRN